MPRTVRYVLSNGGVLSFEGSSNTNISNDLAVGDTVTGNVEIKDTAQLTIGNELLVGDSNGVAGNVTQTGGTVTVNNRARIGHWPNETSTYTMSGGTLNVTNALNVGWDGTATFTQTGGTVTANQVVIDANGATGGLDTYTLQGGTLNVGSGGITSVAGVGSYALNLGGGTNPVLRATAAFSSALNATLSGTGASAVTVDTNGFDVTLSGTLSGTGGLNKTGTGRLDLGNAASTFSGDLNIQGGTVRATAGHNNTNNTSALGQAVAARTITVGTGTALEFAANDVFGNASSSPTASIVVNGGTVRNTGNFFNTLGPSPSTAAPSSP